MLLPLRRLHLGLPQSQEQVEEFSDAKLVYISPCLSVCLSVCPSGCLCFCLFVCLYIYYSLCVFVRVHVRVCVDICIVMFLYKQIICIHTNRTNNYCHIHCIFTYMHSTFYFESHTLFILILSLVQGKELFYSRSLLFSIIILFLLLGICFAVARGSYNIYYIYLCGNDPLFVRRAHQAGMILKK